MKIVTKSVFLVFFLWLMIRVITQFAGSDGCSPGNVMVDQRPTEEKIGKKAVWEVSVSNECGCTFEEVKLYCAGLKSVTRMNSSMISRWSENVCLINNGLPIYPHTSITFTYVWTHKIPLVPFSLQEICY